MVFQEFSERVSSLRQECQVCAGSHWRVQGENSQSKVSLHNAHILVDRRGLPDRIKFHYDSDQLELVTLGWNIPGTMFHDFNGFRWSRTEMSRGLAQLLSAIKFPLTAPATWPAPDLSFKPREFMRAKNGEWVRIT